MFLEPTEVFRRCICQRQGKRLCGVSIIHQRACPGKLFPDLKYKETLAFLKLSAQQLGFPHPEAWGTHAFRRGRASEALFFLNISWQKEAGKFFAWELKNKGRKNKLKLEN